MKQKNMHAMVLDEVGRPLVMKEVPVPAPADHQVLVEIHACAVCRTDLHVVDGELPNPKLPLIPGHEIVGSVVEVGSLVTSFQKGDRVGVPWLGHTCGQCRFCREGKENLCDSPLFTGYTIDGGYAEYVVADYRYCFALPDLYEYTEAAPLMCAGLIGYRSYRMLAEQDKRIGIYGFGGAAHIITQVACHDGKDVYAFTKAHDSEGQQFAKKLGAVWAGDSGQRPPVELDSSIIFAPVGPLVVEALKSTVKGGQVICAGIHMSDIPSFPYRILWGERMVRSVANLTRQDGVQFLAVAPKVPVRTEVETFPLEQANEALRKLRLGEIQGAAVLVMEKE
jgi:propanol-preferring alcohol dehydrogenase